MEPEGNGNTNCDWIHKGTRIHRNQFIHDWVGKVIHRELCKNFKFDHTNKWYMHNPESVLENETPKILLDFET